MTQQTNGMPELKYSEETFRDMYEACKDVFKYTCGRQDGISKRLRIVVEKALAKAEKR